MKIIDLFAGAGGLSEGFRQEGYEIIAHVEMDKSACNTLKTREAFYYLKENVLLDIYINYLLKKITRDELYESIPQNILDRVIEAEISNKTIPKIFKQIDELIEGDTVDLIIGGPPCQAYSTAGISRDPNRMKNDPRNYFYRYYVRFLRKYQPKMFVFENVRGILTAQEGKVFQNIKRNMRNAGYKVDYRILNASEFGVSQFRERVIIIGWKHDLPFKYPEFNLNIDAPTIQTLFDDLPKIKAGESVNGEKQYIKDPHEAISDIRQKNWNILTQHVARANNQNDLNIYRLVVEAWNNEGKVLKYNELPEDLKTHKNTDTFLDRYKNIKYERLSHTIVAHISKDGHYYIHPDIEQNRSLTVREAARIQSFPDDFYFEDSRTAAFKQIGNAVPPLMAKEIAKKLKSTEFLL
ncbi:DNA cytosine methyltransferase [Lysinibacillus telephonicus]|uniref:Cytosine-specific methyltransferase n=1 Tax=Lysinibacillus telephonicus TaxID=1714840 RepID=A0A3S0KCE8_9BACI|nr:DNA cytosine methyltransferase [Lysinibacillus telephonicus]RTQ87961.1 DNA cytosine methyltransferase [Lysinibacillus telephonicus]